MKIRFLFLAVLLSCGVAAQEEPPAGETGTGTGTGVESRKNDTDHAGEQGEDPGKVEDGQGDFRPSQEISEDYPVPLPADI